MSRPHGRKCKCHSQIETTSTRPSHRRTPQRPGRDNTRPARGASGPLCDKVRPAEARQRHFREKTRPARHQPRFLGLFPRWANFFALAFTSDRTRRTFSRPEHRDVITVKPTASLNARPGTKLSQQPPSHTLPGTKLSQRAKKRLFLPKMHQQGEFCTARRAQKPSRENFVPAIASSPRQHR